MQTGSLRPAPAGMGKKRRKLGNDTPWALLMLAPNIVGFFMFMVFPILATFFFSFTKYDLILPPEIIGLGNYAKLFRDPIIATTLRNTFVFTLLSVPVGMAISLALAVLLDQKIAFKRYYRGAYFIPCITSMVAVSIVWQWLYNPEFGLINYFLSFFRHQGHQMAFVLGNLPAVDCDRQYMEKISAIT